MIKMQEILDLSVDERILVMEKIWDSIDPADISIPNSHEQELERRLARYQNGETTFHTWDSIKSELKDLK
jgi:putative addiction module component (TIGR02574 family)